MHGSMARFDLSALSSLHCLTSGIIRNLDDSSLGMQNGVSSIGTEKGTIRGVYVPSNCVAIYE